MTRPVEHYRAIWPVLDPTMTLDELVTEAAVELPTLLRRGRLYAAGRPRWCIRPGRDVPGCGGAHTVLVADLAVVAAPRNVDTFTDESDDAKAAA